MDMNMPDETADLRTSLHSWLEKVIRVRNLTPYSLAKKAGLSHTTISRFLDKPETASIPSSSTIDKIVKATGITPPSYPGTAPQAFSEPEIVPFELEAGLVTAGEPEEWWEIRTRILDMAGYLPGDLVKVSMTEKARSGDVVLAQVVNAQTGSAETVFRLYEKPYLVARTAAPTQPRPLLVDDENVQIVGVVVSMKRDMRPHAA